MALEFNDAHIHFKGIYEEYFYLHEVTDAKVIQQMTKERVSKAKLGEWITGGGWNQ